MRQEKSILQNNNLLLCEKACPTDEEGLLARQDLLDYYHKRFFRLGLDEVFPELTLPVVQEIFGDLKQQILSLDFIPLKRIPFFPTINSALWTPDRLLKMLGRLEYEGAICLPLLYQEIQKQQLIYDHDWQIIKRPLYFLGDVDHLFGRDKNGPQLETYFYQQNYNYRFFGIYEMVMLLLMNPFVLSQANFASLATKVQGTQSVRYAYFTADADGHGSFECKLVSDNSAAATTAAKPFAYKLIK